ncbi:MAG TPA: surface-adhesin E family protein [Pyrinomonadaceae bacterium]|nr:surface-adhesin E family protein [Pyrinomonadaceae bacterium]
MRMVIIVLALLFVSSASFAQGNQEAMGGKTSEGKPPASTNKNPPAKTVPKRAANTDKPVYSPCGVNYRTGGDVNVGDKWLSLGQSANRRFWYNPNKTTCDAKTNVLKSWIKEEHKNTDGDYAMVLYEFKCKTKELRVKTVIEYDKTGSLLETNNHPTDPWQEAAPGTAGEFMLRTLCRQP